jgi:hypothetical protein
MSLHSRPAADKFMKALRELRSRDSSEQEALGAAWVLYPDKIKDKSNRSRFLRAYRAPHQNFFRAEEAHTAGKNIVQIVAALDKRTLVGAPKGNLNARGKKHDFSLRRMHGMWRAMSREQQDEFLRTSNLSRNA